MRLTLDWDDDAALAANYDAFERAMQDRQYQLRQSSGGDGYHAVAWEAVPSTARAYERALLGMGGADGLRAELGDDPKRLDLDRTRRGMGSPFTDVLYSRKYMARDDSPPFNTGNVVEPLSGTEFRSEREQYKDPETGRLDYHKLARLLVRHVYGSQRGLAESLGASPSTVSRWLSGGGISAAYRKKLRRRGRSHDLGHNVGDKSADEREDVDVVFIGEDDPQRRTLVEYIDAPWGSDPEAIGDENREYAVCQVETGSVNPEHTDGQIRYAHNRAMKRVVRRLSPESPMNGVRLNLDRDLGRSKGWTQRDLRHADSTFWEHSLLDEGEPAVYWENLPNRSRISGDPLDHIVTEVLLWDEDLSEVLWHVLMVEDSDSWHEHTVLVDSRGWW